MIKFDNLQKINTILIGTISVSLIYELLIKNQQNITWLIGAIIIFTFLLSPTITQVGILFFLLPFQSSLVVGNSFSIHTILQLLFIIKYILSNGLINKKEFILLLLIVLTQLVTVFTFNSSIIKIFSYVITLFLISGLTDYIDKCNPNIYVAFIMLFIIGLIFSSIISYINLFRSGLTITRFSGLWINPNIYGLQLIVSISMIFILMLKGRIEKLIGGILVVILSFFLLLTYSRTTIYAVSLLLLVLALNIIFGKNITSITARGKVSGIIIIVIFALIFFEFVIKEIIEKRGLINTDANIDFSSGRITLLIVNFKSFFEYKNLYTLLFGFGIDNSLKILMKDGYVFLGSHNTYIEVLLTSGFVGLFLWIIFLYKVILSKITIFSIKSIGLSVIILYTFTAHLNNSAFFYIVLTLFTYNFNRTDLSINKHKKLNSL